jgi:hypothetical protein
MFGVSQLYRNNPNGTFTNVTHEVLGRTSWGASDPSRWISTTTASDSWSSL